jgi:integrase
MKVTLRKKKLLTGNYSYYLDIYHQGKRKFQFLGMYTTKDKIQNKEIQKIAEQVRNKTELELQSNNYNFIPEFKRRTSLITFLQQKADKSSKWGKYYNTLKHLKDFAKGDVTFQEIDEAWLERFKEYLVSKVSQNSALTYFQSIHYIFKLAKREKIIISNPAENVSNFKFKEAKIEHLELSEIETLAKTECEKPEVKRAFLFSCFTGLRFSDIKALKWENVKGDHIEIRQEKTDDFVSIPLSATAKNLLANGMPNVIHLPQKYVFDLPKRWYTNEILKKWFKTAKIKKNAHYHISRHTFATLSLTFNVDLFTVSKLLGHRNFKNTQVYAKVIDKKKVEAINSLPEIMIS